MLAIRLARQGRTKYPVYRIVAAESARAATGKFVAVLGHYNPHTKDLVLKKDEIATYLSHGAQPSNTVIKLLQREQVELPKWVKLKTKEPKKINEPEVEAAAAVAEESVAEPDQDATVLAAAAEASDKPADDAADQAEVTETADSDAAQADATESAQDAAAENAVTDPQSSEAA
jgi:small subunit ribosomal protein S16